MSASKLPAGGNIDLYTPHCPLTPLLMATAICAPPWVPLPAQTDPKAQAFDYEGIKDGQLFRTDGATLEALHTPGHTEDHVSFLLREEQVRQRFTLVSCNVRSVKQKATCLPADKQHRESTIARLRSLV